MLDVRDLRLILAISEHGSLVRAARVLGISQPALTRSLAAVEAKLRGPLFERHRLGVVASDMGRAVLAEAADIVDRIEQLHRKVAEVRGHQVQELSVAAGGYVMEAVVVIAAARLVGQFPATRVRLRTANWADVPRAVMDRDAVIGVVDLRNVPRDSGLAMEPLQPLAAIFVTRPGHPLAAMKRPGLPDILAFPFIFISRVSGVIQASLAAGREAAWATGAAHPAFPALVHESPAMSLSLVQHGDAVAALTVAQALPALRSGQVVALPFREPWMSVHAGVIRLRNRNLGEAAEGFLDLLRNADREVAREAAAWCAEAGLSDASSAV